MTTTLIDNLQTSLAVVKTLPHEVAANLNWITIGVICLLGWKLTKDDTFFSRIVRILATLLLISQAWKAMHTGNERQFNEDHFGIINQDVFTLQGLKAVACILPLAFIWVSAFSAFLGNILVGMLDPNDTRPLNLNETNAKLDRLARLANKGHKSSAISLARQMKRSGNYSAVAMDTMIARLRS
jgi:hypothetical protein